MFAGTGFLWHPDVICTMNNLYALMILESAMIGVPEMSDVMIVEVNFRS